MDFSVYSLLCTNHVKMLEPKTERESMRAHLLVHLARTCTRSHARTNRIIYIIYEPDILLAVLITCNNRCCFFCFHETCLFCNGKQCLISHFPFPPRPQKSQLSKVGFCICFPWQPCVPHAPTRGLLNHSLAAKGGNLPTSLTTLCLCETTLREAGEESCTTMV